MAKKKITARFYIVGKSHDSAPELLDALQSVAGRPTLQREAVASGTDVRLERFQKVDNFYIGDLTRIQREDLPSEVHEDGVTKLSIASPLGYCCAFAFCPKLNALAYQHDIKIISPKKFSDYLKSIDANNNYHLSPIFKKDAWEKFESGEVKSFKIRVALPKTFEFLGDDSALSHSIGSMADAYEAPYIAVDLGVGNRKMTLLDVIKESAVNIFKSSDVRSMKAKVVGHAEEINLLDDLIKDKGEVDVADVDPETSYQRRSGFVLQSLKSNYPALVEMFG